LRRFVYAMLFVCVLSGVAEATPVSLSWDPNTEPDLAGYILSYGIVSGQYSSSVDVGNTTTFLFDPPDPSRVYYLAVRAYNTASLISQYSNEVATTSGPPPLTVTGISSNLSSPQPLGTTLTLAATATGGVAPYQYKWWVADGTASSVGQNWSTSNRFAWTPTTSSNYSVTVWARNASSTNDAPDNPAAILTAPFSISDGSSSPSSLWSPVTLVSLTTDRIPPQFMGRFVTFTAVAAGGSLSYRYKWRVYDGTAWTVLQDWSPSNTFRWRPRSVNPDFVVEVWVRDATSQLDQADALGAMPFAIVSRQAP
jgi:hypothetical protein